MVQRLPGEPAQPYRPSQFFVSHINGSPRFIRKYMKSCSPRIAWVGG